MDVLQFFTILSCGVIAFQDFKERAVTWLVFPIVGFLLAFINIKNSTMEFFLFFGLANIFLVSSLLTILWLYTKYIKKERFLNTSFGLGDVLFFYAFALGFPTTTFIVLLVSSILFSLFVFVLMGFFKKLETVPLAGLMGVFLIIVLLWSLLPNGPSLYLF